ncbi:MAG: dihydrofolate reductase [Muribaculaceae bacterium]|nr:dihydrofolate reductase [Muribaculaceae bacterium]
MITIIAAITTDRALGRGGDMLYHISADLKRFKAITMGHPIIMGRKTFESFPSGPLPGRRNLVVTRNQEFSHPGIETFSSLEEAIAEAGDKAYVIGGGEIYRQAMHMADRLEITEIDADGSAAGADTYFPEIDHAKWQLISEGERLIDPRSGATYRFLTYKLLP